MSELIKTKGEWEKALARLAREPAIALDTETDAFFAYRPKICLIQISTPDRDWLIDPLADLDLLGLGELLADTDREVVLHAGENDVIHLKHEFGWTIAHLFDTQVACFVLGLPPYSLAGVLEARFELKLDKKLQRSDWSRRPLSGEQLHYAADDTHYLLQLAQDLKARAIRADRMEEIESECARVAARDWEPEPFDPEAYRKMAGAKELHDGALKILRALFLFRNDEAERRNRAPYRVVGDHALVAIACNPDRQPGPGVPRSFWGRYGRQVVPLIQMAKRGGPLPKPRRRRSSGGPLPAAIRNRYNALRKWRSGAAKERGVEPFVVARNELLMEVAKSGGTTVEEMAGLMEPFRLREYGEAMQREMLDSKSVRPENASEP